VFNRQLDQVYDTKRLEDVISPRDHHSLMNQSIEKIRLTSKGLMSTLCDKDRAYFKKN